MCPNVALETRARTASSLINRPCPPSSAHAQINKTNSNMTLAMFYYHWCRATTCVSGRRTLVAIINVTSGNATRSCQATLGNGGCGACMRISHVCVHVFFGCDRTCRRIGCQVSDVNTNQSCHITTVSVHRYCRSRSRVNIRTLHRDHPDRNMLATCMRPSDRTCARSNTHTRDREVMPKRWVVQ